MLVGLLLAVWIGGIAKLFRKDRRILAWIALAGVIIPFVAPVGFFGWFIPPNPQVGMKPSD